MSDVDECPTCEAQIDDDGAIYCSQCGVPVAGAETFTGTVTDSVAFDEARDYVAPSQVVDMMTPKDRVYRIVEDPDHPLRSVWSIPVLGTIANATLHTLDVLTLGSLSRVRPDKARDVLAREGELSVGESVGVRAVPLDRIRTDSIGWRLVETEGSA